MQYLASPYSHYHVKVRDRRFKDALKHTKVLLNKGLIIYSPIVNWHTIERRVGMNEARYGLPTDFKFWKRYNFEMLSFASALRVLTLPGWLESVGVKAEIQEAKRLGIKIFYDELGKENKTASGKVIGYINPITADAIAEGHEIDD